MLDILNEGGIVPRYGASPIEIDDFYLETGRRNYKEKLSDMPLKLATMFDLRNEGFGPHTEITGTMFRLDNGNTLYNPSDAGQFLWGAWMKKNNFTKFETLLGSNINQLPKGYGFDSAADQSAIFQGYNWQKRQR